MNEALVVILAFLWALVLLPGAIRNRRMSLRATMGGFQRAMSVLRERPSGRALLVPEDPDRIVGASSGGSPGDDGSRRTSPGGVPRGGEGEDPGRHGRGSRGRGGGGVIARRRRLFVRLLMGTVGLLVAAVVMGGVMWLLLGVSTAMLAGYTVLLRRWKLQRDEARAVVRHLTGTPGGGSPQADERPEPQAVRVAGGGPVTDYSTTPWTPSGHVRLRHWQR